MGFGDWLRRKVSKKGEEEVLEEAPSSSDAKEQVLARMAYEQARGENFRKDWQKKEDERPDEDREKYDEAEKLWSAKFADAGFNYYELKKRGKYQDILRISEAIKAKEERELQEKLSRTAYGGAGFDPSQMTPDEQKAYKKRIEEAKKAKTQAAFEIWETGVSNKKKVMSKVWRQAHYVNELGQPIPEPTTPEEKAKARYVPGEWVFVPVEQEVTPTEQLQEAIAIKHLQRQSMIEEESIKDFKRERSLPHRVARGAGQFAQGMVATTITGTAGMARGIMPSQRGSRQAAATLMPRVDPSLYSVGAPPPTQSGLRPIGGLSHLRSALLPRAKTTATRRIRPF